MKYLAREKVDVEFVFSLPDEGVPSQLGSQAAVGAQVEALIIPGSSVGLDNDSVTAGFGHAATDGVLKWPLCDGFPRALCHRIWSEKCYKTFLGVVKIRWVLVDT